MSIGLDQRTHVLLGKETVTGVTADDNPGVYPGEDHAWSQERFLENLNVKISKCNKTELEVDLVGIDASVANAIRRITIAEVPTVAVENVYIWNNTSVIQDEVLSQRLGLVPLRINPGKIEFKGPNDDPTDLNTVVFSLVIACTAKRITSHAKRSDSISEPMYENEHVYSSSFSWQAKGVQEESFATDPPKPVLDDILLAKLRPGQEIILEMHCEKGVGREHAKWSPVGTASYRLLPAIKLLQPIPSQLCDKFAACFAPGVVEVREDEHGSKEAMVINPRKDTLSREVLRHAEFENLVSLGRKRDHFIYCIESIGQYDAQDILPAAIRVFLDKISNLRSALDAL